jgi:hypothetical protein
MRHGPSQLGLLASRTLVLACALSCTACGPDPVTATSAATAAAASARQAQEDKAKLEQGIRAAQEAESARRDAMEREAGSEDRPAR